MDPFSQIGVPGLAISPNPPQSVQLTSGGIFLFPNGNFYVVPDAQTAIEFFDSNSGQWRTPESGPVNAPILISSNGSNVRAINLSGTIIGAKVTTPGTVYNQATITGTFAAPASGVTATGTPIVGGSLSLAVTTAGAGYTNPVIVIPPPQLYGGTPGLCLPATATVSLNAGALNAITIGFAGAGYGAVPPVTVLDPTGSGALITATITNGTGANGGVTGFVMTGNGSGYDGTHIPAVTLTGAGSSGTAAATALPSMALTGVTIAGTNTGYSGTTLFESSLGAAGTAPGPANGDTLFVRSARGTIAQSGGVLGTVTIEDGGNGFQTVPIISQLVNAGSNATFTAVVGGVINSLIFWQVG